MAKVTEKNTKKEILEALREAEAKLNEKKAASTTTADTVAAKKKEEVKTMAKEVAEMDILNPTIVEKYKALMETLDMLEKEIEEVHEIKKGMNTLEAIHVVNAQKTVELKEKYEADKEALEKDFKNSKAAIIEELKAEEELSRKKVAALREEYTNEKKALDLKRAREEEEFQYNLKRTRAIENDKWNDEKAAREKVLKDKETAVLVREGEADILEARVVAAENKVDEIKKDMEEAVAEAYKNGQAKAEKNCAIKINSVQKEAEWQRKMDQEKIDSLNGALNSKDAEIKDLKTKLDEAYGRIQEMAIEQSKSSNPRIIEKQQ